jgi:hypothetical protein
MAKKTKPLLHLVRGGKDPSWYSEDLDWYFGVAESLSGYRSSMGGQIAVLRGEVAGSGPCVKESNFYTDSQVGWRSDAVFSKLRRVWGRLGSLPYDAQRDLAKHYEARQWFAPEYRTVPKVRVQELHKAYYNTKELSCGKSR